MLNAAACHLYSVSYKKNMCIMSSAFSRRSWSNIENRNPVITKMLARKYRYNQWDESATLWTRYQQWARSWQKTVCPQLMETTLSVDTSFQLLCCLCCWRLSDGSDEFGEIVGRSLSVELDQQQHHVTRWILRMIDPLVSISPRSNYCIEWVTAVEDCRCEIQVWLIN